MEIFIFLLAVILFGIMLTKNDERSINIYYLAVFATMLAIVGLRHISLGGVDTELVYVPTFERYIDLPYEKIIDSEQKDVVFYLLARLISSFVPDPDVHVIIFVLSIPYLVSVTYYIKKYSKLPWLSFLLFMGLGYFGMSFLLLRQVIAMSFVIFSYSFLLDRNLKMFMVFVLLASLFHQTALIFLIAYPVSMFVFSRKHIVIIIAGIMLSGMSQEWIMQIIFSMLEFSFIDISRFQIYETADTGLNLTGFFIQLCVAVCALFCLAVQKRIDVIPKNIFNIFNISIKEHSMTKNEYRDINLQLNLLIVSLFFLAFSPIVGEFWRIASYFGIFTINLLPNIISNFKYRNNRAVVSAVVGIAFCLYFLFVRLESANMIPYKFFWM